MSGSTSATISSSVRSYGASTTAPIGGVGGLLGLAPVEFVEELLDRVEAHASHSRCSRSGPRKVMFGKNENS